MGRDNKRRESIRLQGFDYNSAGAYFLTICTENRQSVLSTVVGGDVLDAPYRIHLLPYGEIADKYIQQLNDFYSNIRVDGYVIMPNHIHLLLMVTEDVAPYETAFCGVSVCFHIQAFLQQGIRS